MAFREDALYKKILDLVVKAGEPLETKEIEIEIGKYTRTMILYRLYNLRGEGRIKGKQVGSGKGTWIWWKDK